MHGGPSLLVLFIYLFVLSRYYCIFYCFYWLICYVLSILFINYVILFYFILCILPILFILCVLFYYLLTFYFFVCGAVNVRVWMPRIYYYILNECECVRVLHLYFNIWIAHTARAPPGLLFFDHLSVISRGSNGTTVWWYTSPACEPGRYNYCDSLRLGGLPPSL